MNIPRNVVTHGYVSIHKRNLDTSDRNPNKFMVAYSHNSDCMPDRSFRHKGFNSHAVCVRSLQNDEIGMPVPWRYRFYTYPNAESLIKDEWRITQNKDWILELSQSLSSKENIEDLIAQSERENNTPQVEQLGLFEKIES